MYAVIEMSGADDNKVSVELLANAATVVRYKMIFHEDLQKVITPIIAGLADGAQDKSIDSYTDDEKLSVFGDFDSEAISKLAYVMNKQALGDTKSANVLEYMDWLEGFSPIAFTESAADIIMLYFGQKVGTSNPKKSDAPQKES